MAANRRAEVDKALADVDFTKNKYQVEFDTTMGKILLDVYPDLAPGHAKNLIGLTKIGFYNGIIFHRARNKAAVTGIMWPSIEKPQSLGEIGNG